VVAVAVLGTAVRPVGVVADARDADKEIYVAHDFREEQRWNCLKRKGILASGLPRLVAIEAHLVGYEIGSANVMRIFDAGRVHPNLRPRPPARQLTLGRLMIAAIPLSEEGALPATNLGQLSELRLPNNVCRKPV